MTNKVYVETVGWMNDSEWNCEIRKENPVEKTPLTYKSEILTSEGFLEKNANRHIFEFASTADAEECLRRIEAYRNSEPTEDPFEKGKCILGEDDI